MVQTEIGAETGTRKALIDGVVRASTKNVPFHLSGTIIGGITGAGASLGFSAASVGLQTASVIESGGANTLNSYSSLAASAVFQSSVETGKSIVAATGATLGGLKFAYGVGKYSRNVHKANKAAARNGKVNRRDRNGADGRLRRQNAFRQRKASGAERALMNRAKRRNAIGGNKARWMLKMAAQKQARARRAK